MGWATADKTVPSDRAGDAAPPPTAGSGVTATLMLSDADSSGMNEIRTSAEIDAPPAAVWAALTDFAAYPEWNPFMRVEGRPNLGARLVAEIRPPGMRASTLRPRVVRVERDRELRWVGHLFVPGVFDGEHRFELAALDDGRTRLTHAETFGGALAGALLRRYGGAIERGFREMNAALKARAEATADADGGGRARVRPSGSANANDGAGDSDAAASTGATDRST